MPTTRRQMARTTAPMARPLDLDLPEQPPLAPTKPAPLPQSPTPAQLADPVISLKDWDVSPLDILDSLLPKATDGQRPVQQRKR